MEQTGDRSRAADTLAVAAAVVGGLFAAVSIYWGFGGTWLLDTIGGNLESQGRAGSAGIVILLWASVVLKIVAALLPLAVVRQWGPSWSHRAVVVLAWLSGVILTGYGLVLTVAGLLVQVGVIATGPESNLRALAWHAFLWDPWFLVWGLLSLASLTVFRRTRISLNRARP